MSENLPQSSTPPQKSSTRFVLTLMIIGILLCVSLVSIYFPRMISWYFDPPTPMGVSCTSSIQWAIDKLQKAQLIAMGVGAVLGIAVGLKFRKRA